jgi:hypothetical protein
MSSCRLARSWAIACRSCCSRSWGLGVPASGQPSEGRGRAAAGREESATRAALAPAPAAAHLHGGRLRGERRRHERAARGRRGAPAAARGARGSAFFARTPRPSGLDRRGARGPWRRARTCKAPLRPPAAPGLGRVHDRGSRAAARGSLALSYGTAAVIRSKGRSEARQGPCRPLGRLPAAGFDRRGAEFDCRLPVPPFRSPCCPLSGRPLPSNSTAAGFVCLHNGLGLGRVS